MSEYYIHDNASEVLEQKRTPQGGLKVRARICRIGLLQYIVDGKPHIDLRRPESVFSKEYLDSVHTSPLTVDHPKSFVNPKNWRSHAVGHPIQYPEIEDNKYVVVDLHITDEQAIKEFEQGTIELSVGLTANRMLTDGEWEGQHYDGEQLNLRNNHIALVKKGRAGPDCKILKILDTKEDLVKLKIYGTEFDLEKEVCDAIEKELSKVKSEVKDLEDLNVALKKKAERAEAKLELLDSKEKDSKESESIILSKAKEIAKNFVSVYAASQKFLDAEEVKPLADQLDSVGIQKAIIKKEYPKIDLTDKSDEKIDAMFELIMNQSSAKENKTKSTNTGRQFLDAKGQLSDLSEALRKSQQKITERSTAPLQS